MARFRIQLLLEDNTWSTIYTIEKNTNYSVSSTDWELLYLDITQSNYGIKLISIRSTHLMLVCVLVILQ